MREIGQTYGNINLIFLFLLILLFIDISKQISTGFVFFHTTREK